MHVPRKDQFQGCLIGQAAGDALGFPVEGHPPEPCRRYVRETLGPTPDRAPPGFGQYSDDTQLARELMQSVVEVGRFDPADYARRIAAIFADNRIVGRGRATDQAARRLAAGVSWEEAGEPPPSAGNGSAMRAAPIGLLYCDDPDRLIPAARDQGRITHADPRCSAGAAAIAGATAIALQNETIAPETFLDDLVLWVRGVDEGFATQLQKLEDWVGLDPEDAQPHIARAGVEPGFQDAWQGISPFVVSSVLWSLYAFLRAPDDYWSAVCTAIEVGGDVDTTAAMTGAISGAALGLAAVPENLARQATDRGTWGYDELMDLAGRFYDMKMRGAN